MPPFVYRCQDHAGKVREGLAEGETREQVAATLRERGWRVLELSGGDFRPDPPLPQRPRRRSVSLFSARLATLVGAGVGIVHALEVAGQVDDPAMSEIASLVAVRVLQGQRLSQALERFPGAFDSIYVSLIRVGEETGALVAMLHRLSAHLQSAESRLMQLKAALIYPAVLTTVTLALGAFMMFSMAPRMCGMLVGMGVELPWLTQVVLALGKPPVLGAALAGAALLLAWLWALSRTPAGRLALEAVAYESPVVGGIAREALLARLSFNLSLMLETGLSWPRALQLLTEPSCGYEKFDRALRDLGVGIGQGDLLEAIEGCAVFPPVLKGLLGAGLESRSVPRLLRCYVELAQGRLDMVLSGALQLLEPFILLGLGVVMGVVVIASFLPVYRLMLSL